LNYLFWKGLLMAGDPRMVVVTEKFCNACGTPQVDVHHQSFPAMRIGGESPDQAAHQLAARLKSNLTAVSDPMHRAPVEAAIAEIQRDKVTRHGSQRSLRSALAYVPISLVGGF
jgi:hypothetical protein